MELEREFYNRKRNTLSAVGFLKQTHKKIHLTFKLYIYTKKIER